MADDEWIDCKLADACSSIDYGLTASAVDIEVGPRFLRITDIVSGHIDWKTVPHVAADERTIAKYRLDDGDIVLARTGASTGTSGYVKTPPAAVFASYLVRLKTKPGFDSRFLAYYLKSDAFWTFIRGVLGDKSAQPNASASTMTQAPLRVPKSRNEQRAIGRILGTLDDKIELNRRLNETLEAIAGALFKSWFVDFDHIRAKVDGRDSGLPEVLSDLLPVSFEDSEIGEVPKGWQVRGLDQIARFVNGLALQKYPPTNGRGLPVIKIAQLRAGSTQGADSASADLDRDYVVEDGDVLFSWSGSLECVLWAGGRGALNQHLFKVTSTDYPKWFYYWWIHQHLGDFRQIAAGKATTMGHIQRHHLSEAKVLVPPSGLLAALDVRFDPLVDGLWRRRVESRTLAALRDALLPRLLSGELRIKDAERIARRQM